MAENRKGEAVRSTGETEVAVEIDLDGSGKVQVDTGVAFLDHMLGQVARHGLMDLKLDARGDLEVDFHHLVEDVGIALGQALGLALGGKEGLERYGSAFVPMDEALAMASVDCSGRGLLVFDPPLPAGKVGEFDTELVEEFFRALAHNAGLTLHLQVLRGKNAHHVIEALFKACGRALGQATRLNQRVKGVPSTKGVL